MKTYILKDPDGDVAGVVVAKNKKQAYEYLYDIEKEVEQEHRLTKSDIRDFYQIEEATNYGLTNRVEWIVIGRRWFDKATGNTYHSVTITSADKHVQHHIPLEYGYDDQYRHTAFDWLIKNKYWTEKDRFNHDLIRQKFYFEVVDVARKRDL